jgi:poly-gamma-glutamate capsule biosynthesis protein CapA/YwtB (metallophosphatase superfamily)
MMNDSRNQRVPPLALAVIALSAGLLAADAAWKWSGTFGDKSVSLLIIGDIQVHSRRADPVSAFVHLRETLQRADLVYANLEGVLVRSQGPDGDIPDKKGWTHPGPGAAQALKASNIAVVGVANNVAYGRNNILATLGVLDGQGIAHAGAGRNIDEAHKPAILERKGVKIGFLQYTARWYREDEQIATPTAAGVARISSRDGITIDAGDLDRLRADVRRLRSMADIVVVSHHNRDGATPVQFGTAAEAPRSGGRADRTKSEEYQRQFAHVALDSGADLVFGHGTHTIQGVEVYKGKPILYAIGHSAFDQPGYEDSKDGLVIRAVVLGKQIVRVSFVPVTRDAHNDVMMLDPASEEGARLLGIVKGVSPDVPLRIDGQEVVLLDKTSRQTSR